MFKGNLRTWVRSLSSQRGLPDETTSCSLFARWHNGHIRRGPGRPCFRQCLRCDRNVQRRCPGPLSRSAQLLQSKRLVEPVRLPSESPSSQTVPLPAAPSPSSARPQLALDCASSVIRCPSRLSDRHQRSERWPFRRSAFEPIETNGPPVQRAIYSLAQERYRFTNRASSPRTLRSPALRTPRSPGLSVASSSQDCAHIPAQ